MGVPVAERYLLLGLRLGRHVEGVVDAYVGPSEIAATVAAEPLVDPAVLVADADALLADLEDGWLPDQVAGLRTFAGVLAGEPCSYGDEVEGCYGVRPSWTDEAVFEAAHAQLDELLPGRGSLRERHERWEAAMRVPEASIGRTVAAVIEESRRLTSRFVRLPDGEGVDLELVHDEPWLGFNSYQGNLRGRVSVNVTLPLSAIELLVLTLHEGYPGHEAERACKEQHLVRERGLLEESIVLVPTPQSLVTEGIGKLAPELLLEGPDGERLAAIVREAGVAFDLPHAVAVRRALEPCQWAEVNAAVLLHERGADDGDVLAYLRRWGLLPADLAVHLVRFLREPTSRTYIVSYPAGHELCRRYAAGDPERVRRLLTEQVRVGELLSGHT